jgi:hypothetical protein
MDSRKNWDFLPVITEEILSQRSREKFSVEFVVISSKVCSQPGQIFSDARATSRAVRKRTLRKLTFSKGEHSIATQYRAEEDKKGGTFHFANFGRKSSRRIFFITSSGTLSSGAKPVSGFVASRPILALTPPGPADGSSSLPWAFGITTRP